MNPRNFACRMASGFVSGFGVDPRENIAAPAAASIAPAVRAPPDSRNSCTASWTARFLRALAATKTVRSSRHRLILPHNLCRSCVHEAELQCSTESSSTQCSDSSSSGLPQHTGCYPLRAFALLEVVVVSHQPNLRSGLLQNQHLQIACHLGVWARNCAAELNPKASPSRSQQSPLPHNPVAGPVSAVLLVRNSAAEQVDPHQAQHWSHCPDFHPYHSVQSASSEAHPNDPAGPQSKVRAPLHQSDVVCACVELQLWVFAWRTSSSPLCIGSLEAEAVRCAHFLAAVLWHWRVACATRRLAAPLRCRTTGGAPCPCAWLPAHCIWTHEVPSQCVLAPPNERGTRPRARPFADSSFWLARSAYSNFFFSRHAGASCKLVTKTSNFMRYAVVGVTPLSDSIPSHSDLAVCFKVSEGRSL